MKAEVKQIEGYAYGAIQPSVVLTFSDYSAGARNFNKKLKKLLEYLPRFEDQQRFFDGDASIDQASTPVAFVTLLDTLNNYCGDQRFTPIHVFEEEASLCFALPTLSTAMTRLNMNTVKHLLGMIGQDTSSAQVQSFLEKHKGKTRPFLPAGTNAGSFIEAAAERKIPFKIFNQIYVIFGYGSGSRIFSSSIADEESAIGVGLAKSKVNTNRLLKMSGIPVAEQARVRTIDDAIRFAGKIGYPVVLKPEAEEQGRGVCTFLQTQLELEQIFQKLIEKFKSLIVERHYFGDGYRVYVLNNQVVRVRKLEAAHVVGDGNLSIQKLIDKENSADERNSISASIKKIVVDGDVKRMLQKQNLGLQDVPIAGAKVLLASTTNLSRGGKSTDFFESLHPENRRLCEEASKTIGLYCSGVDLISPDASLPWHKNGAIVCEVNAQPQIGSVGKVAMHDQMIHDAKIQQLPISINVVGDKKQHAPSIFNKCDDHLKITISSKHILDFGCPVQYFDELEISDDVSDEERQKIERMLASVKPEFDEIVTPRIKT